MRRSGGLRGPGMRRLAFLVIFGIVFCYLVLLPPSSDENPETDKVEWKSLLNSAIDNDVERVVSMHKSIWRLLKLSPAVEEELNDLVAKTNKQLQFNKYYKSSYYEEYSKVKPAKSSLSKDEYDKNHQRRLSELGLSSNAITELTVVLETAHRALYDPNAYLDPTYVKELAQALRVFFQDGPPKCCDEEMYKRAKNVE